MSDGLERTIAWYAKSDGSFVGERPLISLTALWTLLSVSEDDLLYDSYPIGAAQAGAFEFLTGRTFDLDRYDYFLECHATEEAP